MDENKNPIDAAISAEGEALVTLYFRVNSKTATSAAFSFGNINVTLSDVTKENVNTLNNSAAIAIGKFLDANDDGIIDMRDFRIASDLAMNGEYLVNVDVNKNGSIDLEDLKMIYKFFGTDNIDELLACRAVA